MRIFKLALLSFLLMLTSTCIFSQVEWVPFNGEIPGDAVIGGTETNRSLPVCRANYNGAMHPGKLVEYACNIGYGGKEIIMDSFEILINKGMIQLDWEKSSGPPTKHAIKGGSENGQALYVGRAHYKEGTHPGKVFKVGDTYICNIGYAGKELTFKSFEVLVEHPPVKDPMDLTHDVRCANRKGLHTIPVHIGTMNKEQKIGEKQSLVSKNLRYQTRVSDDGRLVVEKVTERALCDEGKIVVIKAEEIWSNTTKKGDPARDYYFKFQNDGNLCIYDTKDKFVWCSMSNGTGGDHLELTNNGHLEIVNDHGVEVWPDK